MKKYIHKKSTCIKQETNEHAANRQNIQNRARERTKKINWHFNNKHICIMLSLPFSFCLIVYCENGLAYGFRPFAINQKRNKRRQLATLESKTCTQQYTSLFYVANGAVIHTRTSTGVSNHSFNSTYFCLWIFAEALAPAPVPAPAECNWVSFFVCVREQCRWQCVRVACVLISDFLVS